ncbi:MAG: hypothetical protein AB8B72_06650 [Crocinitomicaceae bacterium]
MALVKKYFGLFLLLLALLGYGCFQLIQKNKFNSFWNNPKKGDIYIFSGGSKMSPYLLDIVVNDSLYFFSHPYDFSDNLPSHSQILEDSFHDNIHYIYGQSEIIRLIEEERIIKIYR